MYVMFESGIQFLQHIMAPTRILPHLNQNVMTAVEKFADPARPLSIKSDQTTPTQSWRISLAELMTV